MPLEPALRDPRLDPAFATGPTNASAQTDPPLVRKFRQIVLWPLQLMPLRESAQIQQHWDVLDQPASPRCAKERDQFTGDPAKFQGPPLQRVRHLPAARAAVPVRRGRGARRGGNGSSPIRVFRRADVARVRLTFLANSEPALFEVAHVDLYFFYDIDIVILAVEISRENITLDGAQETLYRSGAPIPTHWEPTARGATA